MRLRSRRAMHYVLSDAVIEHAVSVKIADTLSEDEESSQALLEAYYRTSIPEYSNAMRLLARRGYSASVSNKAVKNFLSVEEDII